MTPLPASPPLFSKIIHIMLPGGERCPSLVCRATGLPLRIAVRWVVRYRRRNARPATIKADLQTIGLIYQWAWEYDQIDLDNFLVSGQMLSPNHLQSLIATLEQSSRQRNATTTVSGEVFDRRLLTASAFLTWTLYPEHRGGSTLLTRDELATAQSQLEHTFRFARIGVNTSRRMEPFTSEEVALIRLTVAAERARNGRWYFPHTCFAEATRLRNWLMIELALNCGFRRSELLKLHLAGLPKGGETFLRFEHHRDDPEDTRLIEPAAKTTERVMSLPTSVIPILRSYLTTRPPLGRRGHASSYLFTTRSGQPLSIEGMADVMDRLGAATGITPMSWHRFRHTWAEAWAAEHGDDPLAEDRLMYLGGWTSPASARHYTEHARAHRADALRIERTKHLFGDEDTYERITF